MTRNMASYKECNENNTQYNTDLGHSGKRKGISARHLSGCAESAKIGKLYLKAARLYDYMIGYCDYVAKNSDYGDRYLNTSRYHPEKRGQTAKYNYIHYKFYGRNKKYSAAYGRLHKYKDQ